MLRCGPLQPEAFEGDFYHLDMMIDITFPEICKLCCQFRNYISPRHAHCSSNKLGLKA
jgi:hypothetical protein